MALQLNDRVKESSITTGVVPIVLTGSPTGYQNVASSISTSNTFPYVVELVGGSEWEIGVGQYVSSNNSIIRTQILNSSNSSNIVHFSAGTKNVFISVPAAYMALTATGLSQFSSTTSAELASIISDETGSGKLVFSNNAVLVSPSIGSATGTSLNVTGNLNSNTVLVGPATSANLTRFPNALAVVSNTSVEIQQNENHNIGLIAEGVANASNSSIYGIGVYGVGYTNSGTRSGGVVGEGHVTSSSDGGSAIGVRGYAHDIHAGGLNVGLYGDATNGSANYALAMNNGDILSNFVQTWYLNGGLTFTGGANTVTIPNLVSSNVYFSSANGTQPFTVVSNTLVSNLNSDLLDGQHGTYYTGLTGTAFGQANTGVAIGQAAYTQANTAVTVAQAAFNAANTETIGRAAFGQANAAFTAANTGVTVAQAAFARANTETIGQAAFGQANTGVTVAQAAFAAANTGISVGQGAFAQANSAYNTANTKFSANGGTISGSVTITTDLSITGNIYLGGNVTTLSSNNLVIDDSLIYLAQNNLANLQDIGLVGHFTSGTYQHTGFVRDATDGVWKLFSNVAAEPTTTVDFTGAIYDILQVGTVNSSNANFSAAQGTTPFTVVSNTIVSNLNSDFLDGQHGTYYTGLTGSAWSTANTGVTIGQAAFSRANTETIGQAAFTQANTGVTIAQAGFGVANTGVTIAQAAFARANTETIGQAAFGVANTGTTIATSAFTQANTGVTISQAAFTAANTKYSSSGGTITGTVIVSANSSTDAFRITQTGTGNSFIVEDSTNPDSTPFVIDTSGNVGVGIGAPSAKLHVAGVVYSNVLNNPSYLLNSNGSDYGIIQNDSANTWSLARGTSPSVLATPVLTWTSNNQVGIGTTSPVSKLHALVTGASNGTINSRTALHIQNNNITTGTSNARIQFSYDPATPKAWIEAGVYGSDYLAFGSSAGATERMRIDASGNLGIGQSAPTAKLHVQNSTNGIMNEPSGTWAAKIYQANDATANNGLVVGNRWAAETSTVFEVGSLYGNGSGVWTPFYKITGIGTSIWSQGSNVERMRLDSSGNLGIGTSSPSEKLHVNGNLLLENNFAIKQKMANGTATNLIAIDSSNSFRVAGGYSTAVHIHPDATSDTYLHFNNSGSVVVGNNTTATNMYIQNGSLTIGNGTVNSGYKLQVNGSFAATTKSFVIDHPTKPDMKLRYGSLEGPENGVYVRGRLKDSNVIELPDYWTELVHEDTITVNLTAIGKSQDLWVEDIVDNTVIVGGDNINCFYTVFAERKDVEKLIVEF
jgi:hypothetical protein